MCVCVCEFVSMKFLKHSLSRFGGNVGSICLNLKTFRKIF